MMQYIFPKLPNSVVCACHKALIYSVLVSIICAQPKLIHTYIPCSVLANLQCGLQLPGLETHKEITLEYICAIPIKRSTLWCYLVILVVVLELLPFAQIV